MTREFLAIATAALVALVAVDPALAQRGDGGRDRDNSGRDRGGWGGDRDRRDNDRGRNDDRRGRNDWNRGYGGGYSSWGKSGWGYGHRGYYRDDDLWIGLGVGSALYGLFSTPDYGYSGYGSYNLYGPSYRYGGYAYQQAPNPWGLAPYQCRWDREFGYWYDRPADIDVQRCADAYGSVYVVQGSHRLSRYR